MVHRVTWYLRLLRLTDLKPSSKSQNYTDMTLVTVELFDIRRGTHCSVVYHKDKFFTVLDYARNFGNAAKEGLKRRTNWAAYYFTNLNSWYSLSERAMILSVV